MNKLFVHKCSLRLVILEEEILDILGLLYASDLGRSVFSSLSCWILALSSSRAFVIL